MKQKTPEEPRLTLKMILAAELFSKLSDSNKDKIIEQIKALLSRA